MRQILILAFLITSNPAIMANAANGVVPAEYNDKYFANHTENIWLFPDWPFYKPANIDIGDRVEVSNDSSFSNVVTGEFYSGMVEQNCQRSTIEIAEGVSWTSCKTYQSWPVYIVQDDDSVFGHFRYMRTLGGDDAIVDIDKPEPPVTPEPEPPVIVEPEPEPEVPPVVDPINKAQLYGLMTRIENLLNTEDPRAAFSTAANMMRDKADLLERVGIIRQLISEAE